MILDVVKSIGLDEADARAVIEMRSYRDPVDLDWMKSRQYGVEGVPTYMSGGQLVTGAQPYSVLEKLMHKVGAKKRSR